MGLLVCLGRGAAIWSLICVLQAIDSFDIWGTMACPYDEMLQHVCRELQQKNQDKWLQVPTNRKELVRRMFEDDGPLATMGGVVWNKEYIDVLLVAIHPYDHSLDKLSRFAMYESTDTPCDFEWKEWNISLTRELVRLQQVYPAMRVVSRMAAGGHQAPVWKLLFVVCLLFLSLLDFVVAGY